jgi:putative peptidoglycan lipid II flippase
MIAFGARGDLAAIRCLAGATVVGLFVEALVMARAMRRQGYSVRPSWVPRNPALGTLSKQVGTIMLGTLIMSSTVLVEQAMAARTGEGGVSMLSYANKVVGVILGIGATALGTVVLPHFSQMLAQQDWPALRHTLTKYTRLIWLATVPVTALLITFSEPLIRMLFERGSFSSTATHKVSQIQMFYMLQIPFYVLGILYARLISSLNANHLLTWGAFLNLLLCVGLNLVLVKRLGLPGIALSNSLVYLFSTLFLFVMLGFQLRRVMVPNGPTMHSQP